MNKYMMVPIYTNINTVLVLYVDDPANVGTKVKKNLLGGLKANCPFWGAREP